MGGNPPGANGVRTRKRKEQESNWSPGYTHAVSCRCMYETDHRGGVASCSRHTAWTSATQEVVLQSETSNSQAFRSMLQPASMEDLRRRFRWMDLASCDIPWYYHPEVCSEATPRLLPLSSSTTRSRAHLGSNETIDNCHCAHLRSHGNLPCARRGHRTGTGLICFTVWCPGPVPSTACKRKDHTARFSFTQISAGGLWTT
jgi:hypothetical protein